jgi:[acyl-carrier-protein] S-malonyltransferase
MAAVIGADIETVETSCADASNGQVCSPANINSPKQVVIAGDSDAVDRACELLRQRGAKRAVKLNVSAPFHCELMMPAQEKLAVDLENLKYSEFAFPIVHNFDANVSSDSARVADALTRQVSAPVKWLQSVQKLVDNGVRTFVEVGPGKVLSGLVKQIDRELVTTNVEDSDSLKNTKETL